MKKIGLVLIVVVLSFMIFILGFDYREKGTPNDFYQVYLDDQLIGTIKSKEELENYIEDEGKKIKSTVEDYKFLIDYNCIKDMTEEQKSKYNQILNNFKENQPNTSIALYLGNNKNIKTVIDYLANNDDIILNFGSKHDLKLTDILKKQHAYSVCGYNKSTGIVKVVDPHNNSNIKEIHIDELSKLTDTIYITNLAK